MSVKFSTIKKKGGSLVETVIYVGLLVLVAAIIIQMLVSISGVYRNIKVTREVEASGTIVMESLLREIRNASSVVSGESILGANPGALVISGIGEDLVPYEISFTLESGALKISKNGGTPETLTSSSVSIDFLLFTRLASANSEGVRVELEVSGTSGQAQRSERFYGFAVLRGSY